MRIKIAFDSVSLNKKFSTGWGVSYLVNDSILFDAGEKPASLFKNIKKINVDILHLEAVVISHDHWDHTGGLWKLLKIKEGLKVYACPNFTEEFKNKVRRCKGKLIEVDRFTKICKDIYTTGEIAGQYKSEYMPEQVLVVRTNNGLSVLTGCAHPGIVKILKKIKDSFSSEDIYLVCGGFHLMNEDRRVINLIVDEFKRLGVKKVGPSHCSGKEAEEIFRSNYRDDFIPIKVGQVIEI